MPGRMHSLEGITGRKSVNMNMEDPMKMKVDQFKCGGIGICVKECPQGFRFQPGSKKAIVVPDQVPPSLEPKCREVVKMCPNRAIIMEE